MSVDHIHALLRMGSELGADPYAALVDAQLGEQRHWPPRARDRNRGAGYDLALVACYQASNSGDSPGKPG